MMNTRKAQIRKNGNYVKKGPFTHHHSWSGEKKNWLMVIITFIFQLLGAILADRKGRGKRLGR